MLRRWHGISDVVHLMMVVVGGKVERESSARILILCAASRFVLGMHQLIFTLIFYRAGQFFLSGPMWQLKQ